MPHRAMPRLVAGLVPLALWAASTPALPQPAAHPTYKVKPMVRLSVETFPLTSVRLLDGPFKHAMEINRTFILRTDPDRLLCIMRRIAGLQPKGKQYGGWDAGGSDTVGHYTTACSLMYAATGDPEMKRRAEYMVSQMAAVQQALGTGAILNRESEARDYWPRIAAGEVPPMPVGPWYHQHKIMSGLRDAWLYCGSAKAREVWLKQADWWVAVTAKLTPEQWQAMLAPEHGSPHEPLCDAYALTGERKYLDLAMKFKHTKLFDPLAAGDGSALDNIHANTQFPKFTGYERIWELTGEKPWHDAAVNFWNEVVHRRSWVNGGNSQWEFFFPPEQFEAKVTERAGPETCNTYNMLKLTRKLYLADPRVEYVDYYERGLYNHILSSEHPDRGGYVYFTSMRPGHYRIYSSDEDSFWCCVQTGMENHAKYGEMIYARAADRLMVNLFIASEVTWKDKGLRLTQATRFPDANTSSLALTLEHPTEMTLSVRIPGWATGPVVLKVNGKPANVPVTPGSYADIRRTWKSGDRVDIALPMQLRVEMLPRSKDYLAYLYGPILLAGALASDDLTQSDYISDASGRNAGSKLMPALQVPVLIGTVGQAAAGLTRVPGNTLAFKTKGIARPADVTLVPFYRIHDQRYSIYWQVLDAQAYEAMKAKIEADEREAKRLDEITIDRVQPGVEGSESAHRIQSERSNAGDGPEPYLRWRDAGGWFSYDLAVPADGPVSLHCAYWGSDTGRTFDVLVDGQRIATQELTAAHSGQFFTVDYPLAPETTKGKSHTTIRFEAKPGSIAGGLFDLRVLRRGTPS